MDEIEKEKCHIAFVMLSRLCENTMAFIRLSELKGEVDMLSALKIANYANSGIDMIVSEAFGDDAISNKHLAENALSAQTLKKSLIKYQSVDLGLPSGLKWADRNVGAASPEVYGDYFMWGSVTPDTDNVCDWEHAPFNNGSKDLNAKYFKEHKSEWLTDEGVLKPEYDAAHAIMGGSWRMPTLAEMIELIDGTAQSVEKQNGVKGVRFTSNANGNSIFMPFAGRRYGSAIDYDGICGYVWSSSLCACNAYLSHYIISYDGNTDVSRNIHNDGLAVRGVHE